MATRVGIELAPDACRIVEIDAGPAWARRGRETRVRSFAILPPSGPETQARLESLRKRRAVVVVWTASDHRQVVVSAGSYESMRAEAIGSLAAAGLQSRGVWADIAPAGGPANREARRPVIVALASGSELTTALQPLRAAGVRLRTVTTPAMGLASLARLRRAFSAADALEVYVALEEHVTCISVVRSGVLLAARDMDWGYIDELGPGTEPRHRDDITTRLADAIGEFLAAVGGSSSDIGQVCVCGGLPELRSMTAPLMERLDVEVEPLDSLFGIDAANLPEPIDEFRERSAELRLAWAAAADWPAPINLLRARNRQASKTMLARAAVATGVAAGLVVGWRVQQNAWWRATTATPARSAANVRPAARVAPPPAVAIKPPVVTAPPAAVATKSPAVTAPPAAVASRPPVVTPPPAAVANKPPVVTVPPAAVASKSPVVTAPPAAVANKPPVVTAPPAAVETKPPVVTTPPAAVANKPPVVTAPPAAVASKPLVVTPPPAVANRAPEVPARPAVVPPAPPQPAAAPTRAAVVAPPAVEPLLRPTSPSVRSPAAPRERGAPVPAQEAASAPAKGRGRPAPPPEVPLPFDAVLGTILYSPDRKLAIVDGRIVGPGDEVRGARIVDVTPNAVMLRDQQGRLRRLALGAGGR